MIDIYKRTELVSLLNRHKFSLSKGLGQNFLTDRNIIKKITDALLITEEDLLVEVGAGAGTLTKSLSETAGSVVSVEIDSKVIPILNEVLGETANISIINEDFLKVDLKKLTGGKPYKVIGNLPYYITSPIIMKVLEQDVKADMIVFMVQKEVAGRLAAKVGTKDYGILTVAVNYYCDVEYLFTVSNEVFFPKPKVDSAVIRMIPHSKPPVDLIDEKVFFEVIKAGFGQRRKMLGNALKQIRDLNSEEVKSALSDSGIQASRRAETLDISEFARLSNSVTLLLRNKT